MRFLGIDFGERRVGVAISDAEATVATPLLTLTRKDDASVIKRLMEIAESEAIEALVIGEPRRLDGTRGPAAERAAAFAGKLARAVGLPHELIDEALTSVAARERLREAGIDPRRDPGRVDAVAAQIILQEALDRRRATS